MLAFVLLGLVTGVAATDRSYSVGGISLDVTGNSGQIKLYTLADTSNFIQIKQSKLEEYDASGNSVNGHSVNLANSDFGWTPLSGYTQSDGTQYVSTTFQSSFTVGGNTGIFSLMCRLYRNATTVMTGSTSLTVVQNSVKFDINVTRWTFAATANTLQYEIEVASKGGDTGGSMNDRRGSGKRAVVFQNGLIDFPTTAVVDGVANTAITAALQIKSNGQKQVVQFNFPSFARDLVYDPVMCIGCTADGSTGATVGSSALAMAAAVVAAFALQRMA